MLVFLSGLSESLIRDFHVFVYNHMLVAKPGLQNSNGLFIISLRNGKPCNCLEAEFSSGELR